MSGRRPTVRCPECGFRIFDGTVLRSRVLRVLACGGGQAKCRCKIWVDVPLRWREPANIPDVDLPGRDT